MVEAAYRLPTFLRLGVRVGMATIPHRMAMVAPLLLNPIAIFDSNLGTSGLPQKF
jgi:hypothetical protein